ncbi:MAG TPA: hypothetical protein VF022_07455, partial [Rhodanobacteraceae bacterium]
MSTMPHSREGDHLDWPLARAPLRMNRPARERLRIAQVAPLTESVPPRQYGGTERVVAYLSEALAAA